MTVILYPFGFKQWTFPGGEIGVKLNEEWLSIPTKDAFISVKDKLTHDDIFTVLNLVDAIKRVNPTYDISLMLHYMPYARQDRVCAPGESFALETFVKVLASHQDMIKTVFCDDPHSSVTQTLFEKHCPNISFVPHTQATTLAYFYGLKMAESYDVLVGPDKGSTQKVAQVADMQNLPHVVLNKVRKDGKVLYEDFEYDTLVGRVLIVDDIGDGMATFVGCGEMLRRTQPRMTKLAVYVTHGIFSRGLDHLVGTYDAVLTANLINADVKGHSLIVLGAEF